MMADGCNAVTAEQPFVRDVVQDEDIGRDVVTAKLTPPCGNERTDACCLDRLKNSARQSSWVFDDNRAEPVVS